MSIEELKERAADRTFDGKFDMPVTRDEWKTLHTANQIKKRKGKYGSVFEAFGVVLKPIKDQARLDL